MFESKFADSIDTKPPHRKSEALLYLLRDLDSNQDNMLQRHVSYH